MLDILGECTGKFSIIPLYFGDQRGSCMVWETNMGVCPHLDFENIMLYNCLGYNFNILKQ